MADNFVANAGAGGSTFASDDVSGVHHARAKRSFGRDGSAADVGTLSARIGSNGTTSVPIVVKSSAGTLFLVVATNSNAAVAYLKLYDKATTPTSSDTPVAVIPVPGATSGAAVVLPFPGGVSFASGIGMRCSLGAADNDDTAPANLATWFSLVYV
jgi:hypothetical protein